MGLFTVAIVACTVGTSPARVEGNPGIHSPSCWLVAEDDILEALGDRLPPVFRTVTRSGLETSPGELLDGLARGDDLVWIGGPAGLPPDLWVGAFRPAGDELLAVAPAETTPLDLPGDGFAPAALSSAFILSPKALPQHNVDEEPRADFLPLLEARDRFGNVVGYPGVLVSYYAPSLALRRFEGSHAFLFLFDSPLQTMPAESWLAALTCIETRLRSGLQVTACETDYAAYQPEERVRVRVRMRNDLNEAVACEIRYLACAPESDEYELITSLRRCPEGRSETEAVCDFRPRSRAGLWRIRVEVLADPDQPELLSVVGTPELVERREIGFQQIHGAVRTPSIVRVDGPRIELDGRAAYWVGTHYYPSSSWWDWVWRDFRPLRSASDFAAIRRAGYRIARVWVDPLVDETVLRAMDAALVQAAENGIVLDVCLFTQWTREMGFERASGEHVRWDFRDPRDFNLVSISLRHLDLQREFAGLLAHRWKDAGNVVFNLANEVYVNAPDTSQMDAEAAEWPESGLPAGNDRDTRIFRRWAQEIAGAIRQAGATQPIIPGYMFTPMQGGDNFLGNDQADIVPWHSYLPTRRTAATLQYVDPACLNKPVVLEEFGTGAWNSVENYDANAHFALAGGAAAAMSYEWGVSWLAREHGYHPLPLREAIAENPDPRWFAPFPEIGRSWSEKGVSLCGTPSGTGYGSVYHGTPFVAAAAAALGRRGLMGDGLARAIEPEAAYLVVPAAGMPQPQTMEQVEQTLFALWAHHAVFGVWQEAYLASLPEGVKVAVCPAGLATREGRAAIDALRDRGVEVYAEGDAAWRDSTALPRVDVTPGEGVDVLVRRTVRGTLYALSLGEGAGPVSAALTEGHRVELGLDRFALVRLTDAGVELVEGAGAITVDGAMVCTIARGRAVIASEPGESVEKAARLRVCVTEPTEIAFPAPITAIHIADGSDSPPMAAPGLVPGDVNLTMDAELSRYVVHVALERGDG